MVMSQFAFVGVERDFVGYLLGNWDDGLVVRKLHPQKTP